MTKLKEIGTKRLTLDVMRKHFADGEWRSVASTKRVFRPKQLTFSRDGVDYDPSKQRGR